jgi:hypothetical protein
MSTKPIPLHEKTDLDRRVPHKLKPIQCKGLRFFIQLSINKVTINSFLWVAFPWRRQLYSARSTALRYIKFHVLLIP